jgi:nucleotide-binding universal stress UspA family protein
MIRKLLIATHGTKGAKKAESYAIEMANAFGAELHALYVINKDWGSLVGIEWLHSSEKRMEFYRYAESEFYRRAEEVLEAFKENTKSAPCGFEVATAIRVGELAEVIADEAREKGVDLIVIGGSSNGRSEEYKAKVSVKKLLKLAPCPVLIANNTSVLKGRGGDVEVANNLC